MKVWKGFGILITVALVFGCGGGTQSAPPTPTPTGTAVSMVPFKSLYSGKAASGTQISFTLSGSDNAGYSYTGSFTMVSNGATTFEGQNVTNSQITVTTKEVSTPTGSPVSVAIETDVFNQYYQVLNGQLYKTSWVGITGVPNSQEMFSDVVNVGDSGNFFVISYSNGAVDTATWKLIGDTNGNSILNIYTTSKDSTNAIISTETDSYYLDTLGNFFKYGITFTTYSHTITLSGNRN